MKGTLDMKRTLIVFLAAGLHISSWTGLTASAQDSKPAQPAADKADTRKVVKTQDDLPRHTYKIEGKVSEFLLSDKPFKDFVAALKKDTEADLAQYKIEDPTTLQGYYGVLLQISVFEGRYEDALTFIEKIRGLESKESKKLMTGQTTRAMITAKKVAGDDKAKYLEAFKVSLDKYVRALPFEKVAEDVKAAKGRAEFVKRELILGSVQGQLDPVVESQKGELSGELVRQLVSMRVALDHMMELQAPIAEVYTKIIADAEKAKPAAKDIWTPSQVNLSEKDAGTPVVIAVWDSGVDVSTLPNQLYVNTKEVVNGKDDDANGYVDDVNGIALDIDANRVPELLHPTSELRSSLDEVSKYTKGFGDLQSNIDSPEATEVKKHIGGLSQDQVTPFIEDLGLYGNYSHGTHVAGIAADGNPFARILPARLTFDFRQIPSRVPSIADAEKEAKEGKATVEYFKAAGVRVVNMSWGGSRAGIEEVIEKKIPGMSKEERAELSRKIFKISRDALEEAIKGAPDILFIAAAGNEDNDNEFAETLPSCLNLPNLLTVGAIDSAGRPTSFTTFGKNVKLFANGFEVESNVPGGKRLKYSGTSMAAPNAANIAGKLLALNPKLTTAQVIDLLAKGASPLEGQGGRSILSAKGSIELLKSGK
jgi:subtilisin family serine protease